MVKDERGKKFSCLRCGASFIGYPPDDFHQIASIKPDEVRDRRGIRRPSTRKPKNLLRSFRSSIRSVTLTDSSLNS